VEEVQTAFRLPRVRVVMKPGSVDQFGWVRVVMAFAMREHG